MFKFFKILSNMNLGTVSLMILIFALFYLKFCNVPPPNVKFVKVAGKGYEVIKEKIDTHYIKVRDTIYRPGKEIVKVDSIYIEVPADVDTLAILRDFFAKNVYKDTLVLKDSLGTIRLIDTITQNKIIYRTFFADINHRTITDTVIVKEPNKTHFYLGATILSGQNNLLNFAGPSLLIQTKKERIYTLGLGWDNNKSKAISAGIYWKLK